MFDVKQAAADLDSMLHDIVVKQGIFVALNKRLIRYKKYIIVRDVNDDWTVILSDQRKFHIATVFLKVSAFAVCKMHEKGKNTSIDEIKINDDIFRKNYIDSQFYRKTAQSAKDPVTRENAYWRLEMVKDNAKTAKARIDGMFYSSIV
jgi:hypothetical protein